MLLNNRANLPSFRLTESSGLSSATAGVAWLCNLTEIFLSAMSIADISHRGGDLLVSLVVASVRNCGLRRVIRRSQLSVVKITACRYLGLSDKFH